MRKSEEIQHKKAAAAAAAAVAAATHTAAAVVALYCMLHSLLYIVVICDTSQASMAPCVETALQPAPVPDPQAPFLPV